MAMAGSFEQMAVAVANSFEWQILHWILAVVAGWQWSP
jgi:hypothetical protein